jgi:hypothetical protein
MVDSGGPVGKVTCGRQCRTALSRSLHHDIVLGGPRTELRIDLLWR